jgi:CBS domain-containing protein
MLFLGFNNQHSSLNFELSFGFKTKEPVKLSNSTISYLIRNPSCSFKLMTHSDKDLITHSDKDLMTHSDKDLSRDNSSDNDIDDTKYTNLTEFPAECYKSLVTRITQNSQVTSIYAFTSNPQESLKWHSSTSLKITLVSLQSYSHLWQSTLEKPIFIDDCKALDTVKEYIPKGLLLGIQSGAVISACDDTESPSILLILPDSIMTLQMLNQDQSLLTQYLQQSKTSTQISPHYVIDDLQLPNATTTFLSDPITKALETMTLNQFSSLPVVNSSRRVIGMLKDVVIDERKFVKEYFVRFGGKVYYEVGPESRLCDVEEVLRDNEFLFVTVDG